MSIERPELKSGMRFRMHMEGRHWWSGTIRSVSFGFTGKQVVMRMDGDGAPDIKQPLVKVMQDVETGRIVLDTRKVFVLVLRQGIAVSRESYAQDLCNTVFGVGQVSVALIQFVDLDKPSVEAALEMQSQLGIQWGTPMKTWEGLANDGKRAAALFWDASY